MLILNSLGLGGVVREIAPLRNLEYGLCHTDHCAKLRHLADSCPVYDTTVNRHRTRRVVCCPLPYVESQGSSGRIE